MNLLRKELKNGFKEFFWWFIGYGVLVFLMCFKTSAIVGVNGNQQMIALLSSFPKAFRNLFGLGIVDFSKVEGVYTILFMYMALVAAFYSSIMSFNAVSKEESMNTIEFLYVKPVSRNRIFLTKIISGFFYIILFSILSYFVVLYSTDYIFDYWMEDFALYLSIGLFFIMGIFYSLCLFISVLIKNNKTATTLGFASVIITFIILIMALTTEDTDLYKWIPKFLSPFWLFDARGLLLEGISIVRISQVSSFIIFSTSISFILHRNRDFLG